MKRAIFAILIASGAGLSAVSAFADTVDTAFAELVAGRYFRAGFPVGKTRDTLVKQYLAHPGETDFTKPPPQIYSGPDKSMPGHLENAIDLAISAKRDAFTTSADRVAAKYIAWQALDAYLEGQLYAGNRDLLSGLRVAFPSTNGNSGGLAPRPVPVGMPVNTNGQDYYGANILDVFYARYQFFGGLLKCLDFLATDPDGALQGSDKITFGSAFPYYTAFDDSRSPNLSFPRFNDGVFTNTPTNNPDGQAQLVDAYLMGQVLDRYGKSINAIGQRLWQAAYFDKERAPGGSRKDERANMLAGAEQELRKGIHNQFLAVLPLAASLSEEDYQTGRFYQVNNAVTASAALMEHIVNGDIPKLDDRNLQRSKSAIESQINLVNSAKAATFTAHGNAQKAINDRNTAAVFQQQNEAQLRTQLQSQLLSLTGINPTAAPYNGLPTKAEMDAYRNAVADSVTQALNAGLTDPYLTKGAEIPSAALGILLEKNDLESAKREIDSIPQQIRVEENRNGAVAAIIIGSNGELKAFDLAIARARMIPSISVTVEFPGVSLTTGISPGEVLASFITAEKNDTLANKEVQINDVNSRATIENLLIHQSLLQQQFASTLAKLQIATANFNALASKVGRLLDDHVYYQQSTANLWYQNPTLVFDQEQAEKDYQDALSNYTNQLYTLSQMLGAAWSEPYQNPYALADGFTIRPVGATGTEYADFTMPESVFNVYRYQEADKFFAALKEWDNALRNGPRPGNGVEQSTTLSLRQDLLGLSDLKWDPNAQQFRPDSLAQAENVARFRGYLLRLKSQTDANYFLKFEFPITYHQRRESRNATGAGQDFTPFALQRDINSWNERLTKVAIQFVGNNVTQAPAINATVAQYGKVAVPTYAPPPPSGQKLARQQKVINLPEYYYPPDNNPAFPDNFRLDVSATLGNQPANPIDVSNKFMSPFCDKYVFLIRQSAQQSVINIQNIEDINLTLYWLGAGVPPVFSGW